MVRLGEYLINEHLEKDVLKDLLFHIGVTIKLYESFENFLECHEDLPSILSTEDIHFKSVDKKILCSNQQVD